MSADKQTFTMNRLDELFKEVQAYRSSEKFQKYMDFCASFRMLGAYNAMLVSTQREGVRYVQTVAQWKKFNMRPTANACPLVILMPFGPVDFVYDVSDVEHIPGTREIRFQEELDKMAKPFRAEGNVITEEVITLQENLKLLGIKYDKGLFAGSEMAGLIYEDYGRELSSVNKNGKPFGVNLPHYFTISINSHESDAEEFASLCHELGHYFCRHLPPPTPEWWTQRIISEKQMEFEAESVAWLVCKRHGVDCVNSAHYLSGYMDKCEIVPQVAIGTIMSAVDKIDKLFEKMDLSDSPLYKYDEDFYNQVKTKRSVRNKNK